MTKGIVALFAAALGVVAVANGCDGGREGERCNPLLSHDECGSGLSCQQPATCAENYCCPDPASKSANPYCNGMGCPPADGGGDSGGSGSEAGAEAGDLDAAGDAEAAAPKDAGPG